MIQTGSIGYYNLVFHPFLPHSRRTNKVHGDNDGQLQRYVSGSFVNSDISSSDKASNRATTRKKGISPLQTVR